MGIGCTFDVHDPQLAYVSVFGIMHTVRSNMSCKVKCSFQAGNQKVCQNMYWSALPSCGFYL